MTEWIGNHKTLIWWIAGVSVVVFVAALIVVPWLVVRIPSDYFRDKKRHPQPRAHRRSMLRWVLLIGKNLLGCLFVGAGIIMLVLPGQGMVTILIGLTLLNFPGKYRLVRWIVSRRPVLRSINRLRRRAGRPPLLAEE